MNYYEEDVLTHLYTTVTKKPYKSLIREQAGDGEDESDAEDEGENENTITQEDGMFVDSDGDTYQSKEEADQQKQEKKQVDNEEKWMDRLQNKIGKLIIKKLGRKWLGRKFDDKTKEAIDDKVTDIYWESEKSRGIVLYYKHIEVGDEAQTVEKVYNEFIKRFTPQNFPEETLADTLDMNIPSMEIPPKREFPFDGWFRENAHLIVNVIYNYFKTNRIVSNYKHYPTPLQVKIFNILYNTYIEKAPTIGVEGNQRITAANLIPIMEKKFYDVRIPSNPFF